MPLALQEELEKSFGSIETLRREMVVTASSMFGPGFVWLVKDRPSRKYKILCTYLAGSPYPGAHYRRQTVDMNTGEGSGTEAYKRMASQQPVNTVGAHGPMANRGVSVGGIEAMPVLCINTWEHVYLPDYGVGGPGSGGKRAFAESWWYTVDWNVVADKADVKGALPMIH